MPSDDYEDFLSSGIFTLVVGLNKRCLDIHKALLGSVSEEFKNHIYNDMIEGTTGSMKLYDEREDTVTRFIQWAYTKEYPEPSPDNISSVLMAHARLYVFAERFNIQDLQGLAFGKLKKPIEKLKALHDKQDVLAIINLIRYAFENLPIKKPADRLLESLVVYAGWRLEKLRGEPKFFELVDSSPDFVKQLLLHVKMGPCGIWGYCPEEPSEDRGIQSTPVEPYEEEEEDDDPFY